ncbi:transposase [Vibrio sp. SG41-7]|uniref:RNA-guided endonuclease InsQ/TnpB family protein n=1 Tax=Vibrio sp. SG41-7 TaxID=2760973 RepID=UPI00217615C0|nr:transposase [Vibrio sp. SG41-7]
MINLHQAFDNFFNPKLKAKYPQFKRRHGKQSSYRCVGVKVLDGAIKLPKMKPVRANIHREIIGKVKSITLSLSKTGKFYASILVDDGVETPSLINPIDKATGIDLGLSHFAIQSNGKHLVKLAQWYASSKTYHCCSHKMEEMPLSVRKWDCPSCGTTDIDRELNAALNIHDKGISGWTVVSAYGTEHWLTK